MPKTSHAFVLAATLVLAALALVYAKVTQLGLPLLPGALEPVWSVEATIEFDAARRSTLVDFNIPDRLGEFVRLDEYFVSRNYGVSIATTRARDRHAQWSTRQAQGPQRLYYRIEAVPQSADDAAEPPKIRVPKPPEVPRYREPLASAVHTVLGEMHASSSEAFAFASQLVTRLNAESGDGNVQTIRGNLDRASEAWVDRLVYVLAGARISARMVRGVVLEDRTTHTELVPWLEVHDGQRWEGVDPRTGNLGYPENFLRWSVGSDPVLVVEGGHNEHVTFAVSRYAQSLMTVARQRAASNHSVLADTMLFNLPVSTQNVYRVLLMVPLGALVVAVMRSFVGLPTLGTFMPILIALAFRETRLAWGIGLFLLITASGLSLRFYLERLKLLLVPRLCAVLLLVVLLMTVVSLVCARLGIDKGFSLALFPIVILTMVIERMSVIWEESGAGQALREGAGSLVVAVLGYAVMNNEALNHVVFLFPETLLLLLATFILMGRYTGYRLTELTRFRDIVDDDSDVRSHP